MNSAHSRAGAGMSGGRINRTEALADYAEARLSVPTLSPRKREQLSAFLGSLPNAAALRLFAALEADRMAGGPDGGIDLPHDALLADLRRQLLEREAILPVRAPSAKRMFFTPIEDFFIGRRTGQKTRGRIARASLDLVWRLMMTDKACAEAALAAAGLDDAQSVNGKMAVNERMAVGGENARPSNATLETALFTAAEAGLGRIIAHAREDAAYHTRILEQIGGAAVFDDLQEIKILLGGVDFLKDLQALAPSPAASLSEEQFYKLRALFLSAHDQSKLMGGYVLLALKGRLERPWRALGVYYHLARGADAQLRSAKEAIALLPESLFEDLEAMARALERAACGALDGRAARLRVGYFADYAGGLVRQSAKAGDNVSMNRVEACRDIAGEALERFMEQALANLRHAMPVRHAGGASRLASLRPDFSQALPAQIMIEAREAAALIAAAPALAERLSRDAVFAEAIAGEAREKTHIFGKDLVMEIRAAEGEARKAARRMLEHTLKIAGPLLASDEIALLRDRAAAAAV